MKHSECLASGATKAKVPSTFQSRHFFQPSKRLQADSRHFLVTQIFKISPKLCMLATFFLASPFLKLPKTQVKPSFFMFFLTPQTALALSPPVQTPNRASLIHSASIHSSRMAPRPKSMIFATSRSPLKLSTWGQRPGWCFPGGSEKKKKKKKKLYIAPKKAAKKAATWTKTYKNH